MRFKTKIIGGGGIFDFEICCYGGPQTYYASRPTQVFRTRRGAQAAADRWVKKLAGYAVLRVADIFDFEIWLWELWLPGINKKALMLGPCINKYYKTERGARAAGLACAEQFSLEITQEVND